VWLHFTPQHLCPARPTNCRLVVAVEYGVTPQQSTDLDKPTAKWARCS
jgi:hypothetical protein